MRANREQLEERANQCSHDLICTSIALNAICNGESLHVGRKGPYSLTLIGAGSPYGGIVLVRFAPSGQAPYQTAHYFEHWFQGVRDYFGSDKELLGLRDLALQAKEAVMKAQQEAVVA